MPECPPPRFNVLGVGVHALTLADACERIVELSAARTGAGRYVCVTGVQGVSEAQRDRTFREILNSAWLNVPDGMPLVWIGRTHRKHLSRVYGPDLMLEVCGRGRAVGLRHFLYGGAPGIAERLSQSLTQRFPGIDIVGSYTPPYRPLNDAEEALVRHQVSISRADVVWVGLGSPKQERFMASFAPKLEARVLVGVGAAFDFHSGSKLQAPRWIQSSGFEWAFRMATEPGRLAPRYLRNNPVFVGRWLLQVTRLRKYPLE